jgi:hypothetical protein
MVADEVLAILSGEIAALGQRGAATISIPRAARMAAAPDSLTAATSRRSADCNLAARRASLVTWPIPPPSSQARRTVLIDTCDASIDAVRCRKLLGLELINFSALTIRY